MSFWALVGGIGGSRILFMMVNWKDYSGHWGEYFSDPGKLIDMFGSGLVFYGGLIGASFALLPLQPATQDQLPVAVRPVHPHGVAGPVLWPVGLLLRRLLLGRRGQGGL